jgi:hypothetical protein
VRPQVLPEVGRVEQAVGELEGQQTHLAAALGVDNGVESYERAYRPLPRPLALSRRCAPL